MKSESKAFWVFLTWVLLLPFLDQISLKAADDKSVASASQEVTSIQDFEVSDNDEKNDSSNQDAKPSDNLSEVEEKEDEGLPALSADPIELIGKVSGLAKAKKYKSICKQLSLHEDVVVTDVGLLKIYVEALIHATKPNWRSISKFAKMLGSKKRKSSLANYAQGLYYLNKKKPDLTKALKYIKKAKDARKPYPDAGMKYYIVLLKKYWQILLILIAIPVLVVGKILKKKKAAAKADTEVSIDISTKATDDDKAALSSKEAKPVVDSKGVPEDKNAEHVKSKADGVVNILASDKDSCNDNTNTNSKNDSVKAVAKTADEQNYPIDTNASADVKASMSSPVTQDIKDTEVTPGSNKITPMPAPTTEPMLSAVANHTPVSNAAPISASTIQAQPFPNVIEEVSKPQQTMVQPNENEYIQQSQTTLNVNNPNAFQSQQSVRTLTEGVRQDPVADTSELDATWNRLCQKALQKRIPQDFSKNIKVPNNYGNSKLSHSPKLENVDSQIEPELDLNVTIDLSEEALREDLIGKLKMLAISDSELRSLFSQKKPAHIPHLIEYVLTRPEPLRLSFVARELGHYVDPAIIDTLASLLYHEDNRVILGALQGLENTKSSEAILHICPFLKSETPVLAQAARNALSNFGAVKILKAFIHLPVHPDDKIKEAGIFVLSRMKGKQVENLLVSMLDDEAIQIRKTILLAMSYQKNPAYIEPLRTFFRTAKDEDKTLSRKAIVYLQGFVTKNIPKADIE